MLKWLHDGIRCEAIKRDGTRCGNARCVGHTRCGKHGGGRYVQAAKRSYKAWRNIRGEAYRSGFEDPLAGCIATGGRVVLAEAWLAANAAGDPVLYQEARRAVARRYRSRIAAAGRADLLEALGI